MAFSLNTPGNQGNVPAFADILLAFKQGQPTVATLVSASGTATVTGTQIAAGIFVHSGSAGAVASTTDTAANILTALGTGVSVGQSFLLFYVNLNNTAGIVTVAAGTGVSLTGTLTIPINAVRVFVGTVTSATTVAMNSAFSWSGAAA